MAKMLPPDFCLPPIQQINDAIPSPVENVPITTYQAIFFKDEEDMAADGGMEDYPDAVAYAEHIMDENPGRYDYAIIEKVVTTPVARVISERVTSVERL